MILLDTHIWVRWLIAEDIGAEVIITAILLIGLLLQQPLHMAHV